MLGRGRSGVVAAGLVVALALAACSGGGGGEAAPPTTDAPTTTTVDAAATTAVPFATRPVPSTTTTRPGALPDPPPVAVGAFVNGREEPVLGERHGWHLWIEGAGGFFVVDLDTGAIAHVDAPGFFGQLYAVDGGLFSWSTAGSSGADGLYAIDASGRGRRIAGAGVIDFRSTRPDRMWGRTATGYAEFTVDGTRTNEVTTGFRAVSGAIGESLVVADGGAIYLVDVATGAGRRWAVGTITNVGRGRIVWRECTVELRCRSWVGTEAEPRARAIEPTSSMCGTWYEGYHDPCDGSLSADGRFYLATDLSPSGDHRGPSLFELDTTWKDVVRFPGPTGGQMDGTYDGLAMSPDGRWLVSVTGAGHVAAFDFGRGRLVEFDVARGGGRGNAPFALG